jgi:hypothetical protein
MLKMGTIDLKLAGNSDSEIRKSCRQINSQWSTWSLSSQETYMQLHELIHHELNYVCNWSSTTLLEVWICGGHTSIFYDFYDFSFANSSLDLNSCSNSHIPVIAPTSCFFPSWSWTSSKCPHDGTLKPLQFSCI